MDQDRLSPSHFSVPNTSYGGQSSSDSDGDGPDVYIPSFNIPMETISNVTKPIDGDKSPDLSQVQTLSIDKSSRSVDKEKSAKGVEHETHSIEDETKINERIGLNKGDDVRISETESPNSQSRSRIVNFDSRLKLQPSSKNILVGQRLNLDKEWKTNQQETKTYETENSQEKNLTDLKGNKYNNKETDGEFLNLVDDKRLQNKTEDVQTQQLITNHKNSEQETLTGDSDKLLEGKLVSPRRNLNDDVNVISLDVEKNTVHEVSSLNTSSTASKEEIKQHQRSQNKENNSFDCANLHSDSNNLYPNFGNIIHPSAPPLEESTKPSAPPLVESRKMETDEVQNNRPPLNYPPGGYNMWPYGHDGQRFPAPVYPPPGMPGIPWGYPPHPIPPGMLPVRIPEAREEISPPSQPVSQLPPIQAPKEETLETGTGGSHDDKKDQIEKVDRCEVEVEMKSSDENLKKENIEQASNAEDVDDKITDGSQIVVTFTGNISEDTFVNYFENKRKSGGGDVEDIEYHDETGLVVIKFNEKCDARNVFKKDSVHKISGIDVHIHVINSDHDFRKIIEESMVFVKGVKQTTSEDCLRNFIEVKSGEEPVEIRFTADRTSALVTFDSKIDFDKVSKGCTKRLLEGNQLAFYRVPVTQSILVTGISPDISKDTLQYYFENKKKSGGDDEVEIVDYNVNSCVIRFSSAEVVKRVLGKQHKVQNHQLEVSPYYPFFTSQESVLELPEPEILTGNTAVLKFIKNSQKIKEDFEKQMTKHNGKILWPTNIDTEEVHIECNIDITSSEGQRSTNTWRDDVSGFCEEYLAKFSAMKITTLAESWKSVLDGLRNLNVADPDKVHAVLEKENYAIQIVGGKDEVKELCEKIQRIISDAERNISEKSNITSKVLSFKIYKLQLLWRLKIVEMVSEKYPGVKADCNLDKREITLTGPIDSMQEAELFLRQKAESFYKKAFKLSKYKKDLLFKKGSREVWYNETKTKQIMATWNVDRGHVCEMYAETEKEAKRAIICMEDLFLEDEFVVEGDFKSFIVSDDWKQFLNTLEERDEKCFSIKTDHERIQMAATKYIFHQIKGEIEKEIADYSEIYGKQTAKFQCDKGVFLYLHYLCKKDVQNIETPLKKMYVTIKGNSQNFSFEIAGNKTGVSIATKKLKELVSAIVSDKHKLCSYGIKAYFSVQAGVKEAVSIGKRHSCIVLHQSEYSEEKARKLKKDVKISLSAEGMKKIFMHDREHKIYLVEGDITKLKVDAIVNAANNDLDHAGGLAKAIVDAAGQSVQDECRDYVLKKGHVQDGDAMCSGPGRLNCEMIIHAVGPVWYGGKLEEESLLRAAIMECLMLTGKRGYTSIAIPALSGGIFGYPLDKCTTVISRAVKEYFDNNSQTTTVSNVYLCDISAETIRLFDLALKKVYKEREEASGGGGNLYPQLPPLKYPVEEEDPLPPLKYPDDKEKTEPPSEYPDDKEETKPPLQYPKQEEHMDPPYISERRRDEKPKPYPQEKRFSEPASRSQFEIKVVKGLLTERKVDVLVNSIHHSLDLNHGRLSKSILMAAGENIQTELYQYVDLFQPCQSIAVTSGGNLYCKYIFHGTLVPFDTPEGTSVKVLRLFVNLCMKQATAQKQTSIAFPAVGTGILKFPVDIVAKTMFNEVIDFQEKNPNSTVRTIEFVIYPKDTLAVKAFEDMEKKLSRDNPSASPPATRRPSGQYDHHRHSGQYDQHRHRQTGRPTSTRLGMIDVLIKCGDITKEKSDAIVNTTNKSLDLSKGAVSKAILKEAGPNIQKELLVEEKYSKDKDLIVTSGGRLNCPHIFHIMVQYSNQGWETIVTKCLNEAEKRNFKTLSIPALGTGQRGCKTEEVASAIFQAIKNQSRVHSLKQIYLVVFQEEMEAEFISVLKKIAGTHRQRDARPKDYSRPSEPDYSRPRPSRSEPDYSRPRPPRSEPVRAESKPDSVIFYLWSKSFDSIQSVKRELDKIAEEQCHEKTISDYSKIVSQSKISEVFSGIERKYKVKITEHRGLIKIVGPQVPVNKAYDQIRSMLRDKETQMHDYERAKEIASYVQWLYQDQTGDKKFKPFKLEDNLKIETEFKKKGSHVTIQDSKGVRYKIDFQDMVEVASDNPRQKIPVRRGVKEAQKGQVDYPKHWKKVQLKSGVLYHEEEVFSGGPEFDRVKAEFLKSGGTGTIVKIYRVQNPTLYLQYAAKRNELWKKNGKNPEKWLWHGTSADTVDKIMTLGFNRSYCGKNGTACGAGVYFAVNAGYSVGYCSPDIAGNHIFSVQVLTGDTCPGNSGMRFLPNKPGTSYTYDSASDNPSNPVMFVIFHDCQAYPTYHVIFK